MQLIFLIVTQSPLNISIVINIGTPSGFFNWSVNLFMGKGIKFQFSLHYITFHYGDGPPNLLTRICLTFSVIQIFMLIFQVPSLRGEGVTECHHPDLLYIGNLKSHAFAVPLWASDIHPYADPTSLMHLVSRICLPTARQNISLLLHPLPLPAVPTSDKPVPCLLSPTRWLLHPDSTYDNTAYMERPHFPASIIAIKLQREACVGLQESLL